MELFLNGVSTAIADYPHTEHTKVILFVPSNELEDAVKIFPLQHYFEEMVPLPQPGDASSLFESHPSLDIVVLSIPSRIETKKNYTHITIYYDKKHLVFIYEPCEVVSSFLDFFKSLTKTVDDPAYTLYLFLNFMTEKDDAFLQNIEDTIVVLEDSLTIDYKNDDAYTKQISVLRKQLLQWKHYYESLSELLEDLEENENGLFSVVQIKQLHLLTNRANRLMRSVINLNDYVTQVRETYQSQIDTRLSQIMKFPAVLSAIFMPLTLIAGWYGMNLIMPEHNLPYFYPIVIVVCATIVILNLIYFKKKKWF